MLILDNPVSIIIQNKFKYKKQNIIKVNSDFVTCDVVLPCMMLGGGDGKKKLLFFCAFAQWRGEHVLGYRKKS